MKKGSISHENFLVANVVGRGLRTSKPLFNRKECYDRRGQGCPTSGRGSGEEEKKGTGETYRQSKPSKLPDPKKMLRFLSPDNGVPQEEGRTRQNESAPSSNSTRIDARGGRSLLGGVWKVGGGKKLGAQMGKNSGEGILSPSVGHIHLMKRHPSVEAAFLTPIRRIVAEKNRLMLGKGESLNTSAPENAHNVERKCQRGDQCETATRYGGR